MANKNENEMCEHEPQLTPAMPMVEEKDIVTSLPLLSASVDVSLDSNNQDVCKRFEEILEDKICQRMEHIDLQQEELNCEMLKVDEVRKREKKSEERDEYELEENQERPEQKYDEDVYEKLEEEPEINEEDERQTEMASCFDAEENFSIISTYYNDQNTSCDASELTPHEPPSSVLSSLEVPNLELQTIFIYEISPSARVTFMTKSMGNPGKIKEFNLPIYNHCSINIYRKYIAPLKTYYMKEDSTNKISPQLYDFITKENLSLKIFREVAKTLTAISMLPKINQQAEAVVCGVSIGTNQVYLNFNKNFTSLLSYVLKLAVEDVLSKPNISFQDVNDMIPRKVYALVDREKRKYCRVVRPYNHKILLDTFRRVEEQRRQKERQEEKCLNLPDDERKRRENARQKERELQQKFMVVLDMETGMRQAVHHSLIHPISEICEELGYVPKQVKTAIVRYLDGTQENLARRLYKCYKESKVVIVKRPRECFEIDKRCVDLITVE